MAYFWGIFSGIVISVIGQVFGQLFVEPVHDLNEALGKLNSALIFRYNVFGNPGSTNEVSIKTSEELSNHASLLLAKAKRVYWYKCFVIFNLIPQKENICEAHKLLVGISNSTTAADKKQNREDCERIAKLLNLEVRVRATPHN